MSIIDALNDIPIPPLKECGEELGKLERLKSYFYKLEIAPHCNSNDEALDLINETLVEVEDCHSGMVAEDNAGFSFKGRMYPIQEDFISREDNKIVARSKGNRILIENSGDFIIIDRQSDEIIMSKIK